MSEGIRLLQSRTITTDLTWGDSGTIYGKIPLPSLRRRVCSCLTITDGMIQSPREVELLWHRLAGKWHVGMDTMPRSATGFCAKPFSTIVLRNSWLNHVRHFCAVVKAWRRSILRSTSSSFQWISLE